MSDVILVSLPKIFSRSGSITAIDNGVEVPFSIKRVYYLYDIPGGESRGAHGHRDLEQLIVAVSGSFVVRVFDGLETIEFTLNRPDVGLRIRPGIWRDLYNFSSGAICLVLASEPYSEADYIRNLEEFVHFKQRYL